MGPQGPLPGGVCVAFCGRLAGWWSHASRIPMSTITKCRKPTALHVPFASTRRGSVTISSIQSAAILPDALKPSVLGGITALLNNGRATLTDLSVRARPGNVTLVLTTDLLPTFQLPLQMAVLPCPIDSVPGSSGLQCDQCKEDSFGVWQAAANSSTELVTQGWVSYTNGSRKSELDKGGDNAGLRCYSCPLNADCPPGPVVYVPTSGYWSSHPLSPMMHRCLYAKACRHGNVTAQRMLLQCQEAWFSTEPPGLNPHMLPDGRLCVLDLGTNTTAAGSNSSVASYVELQCAPGYEGPTCGVCSKGWHPAGAGKCSECVGSSAQHVGVGAVMLVVNLALVLHTVRSSFAGKRQKKDDEDEDGQPPAQQQQQPTQQQALQAKEQQWAVANMGPRSGSFNLAPGALPEDNIPKPVDYLKLIISHIQVRPLVLVLMHVPF